MPQQSVTEEDIHVWSQNCELFSCNNSLPRLLHSTTVTDALSCISNKSTQLFNGQWLSDLEFAHSICGCDAEPRLIPPVSNKMLVLICLYVHMGTNLILQVRFNV